MNKRAPKTLDSCDNHVELTFPFYPSSGEMTKQVKYKKLIHAYNAVNISPCSDDYRLDIVTYPATSETGLYTPPGKKKADLWNAEHVMDAQLVQDFFQATGKGIKSSQIPRAYRESPHLTNKKMSDPEGCEYLFEFWNERPDPPTGTTSVNAMAYLLQEYPGRTKYTKEMALLPGRLNGKKERVFSGNGKDIVAASKWKKADFDQRVNELRECILLIQVIISPPNTDSRYR